MDHFVRIKNAIEELYQTNPKIHISVDIPRSKIIEPGTKAVITGIYKNIFQIEAYDKGHPVRHTFQYSDVLVGHVVIEELH